MGIPKFFMWLSKSELFNGTKFSVIQNTFPDEIDGLYIDMNALIHDAAQNIFSYGDVRGKPPNTRPSPITLVNGQYIINESLLAERKYEVYQMVFDKVVGLVRHIRPRRTLMMAVDGIPPEAKIMQQRLRRYASAADRPIDRAFDSNAINPGTVFMFELDRYIKRRLEDIRGLDPAMPPRIVYSNHMVYGEGEHKIADELRTITDTNQTLVVHGTDADLIMIYLLQMERKWKNIYLFRESPQYNRYTILNMKVMESAVRILYPGAKMPLDDFVVLLFLNGNDFLPHFPVFERVHDALNTLVYGYASYLKTGPDFGLCDDNGIIWANFARFCSYVTKEWNGELLKRWALNMDNLIKFPSSVALKCVTETTVMTGPKRECIRQFDIAAFNKAWYEYVFSPKSGEYKTVPTQNDIETLINSYIQGVAWVYGYYKKGASSINVGWYYPYDYTPLFSDLGQYISDHLNNELTWTLNTTMQHTEFPNVIEQMIQVMPPKSVDLVPIEIRALWTNTSPIYDLFPESFLVDKGGKQEEWQAFPILPFPNPIRIKYVLETIQFPPGFMDLYKEQEPVVVIKDINSVFRQQSERGHHTGRGGYRGGSPGRGGYRGGGGRGRGSSPGRGRGGRPPV